MNKIYDDYCTCLIADFFIHIYSNFKADIYYSFTNFERFFYLLLNTKLIQNIQIYNLNFMLQKEVRVSIWG